MKKFIIFLAVCVIGMFNIQPSIVVHAEDKSDLEEKLTNSVLEQINNLDFGDLDYYLNQIQTDFDFTSANSFSEVIKEISKGNYFSDYNNVFDAVINLIFGNIKNILPLMFLIIAIAVLGSILNSLKSPNISGGVNDLIHFICFGVVILILVGSITKIIFITGNVLNTMSGQMEVIFPIMLTLLTAIGGVSSAGIYKPVVAVLTQGVSFIFSKLLFPIFILSFVFLVVGNLSKNVKLNRFNEFLSSVFKWVVGFVFTMFGAFLTIQGISAGKFDGISIKATKFAVKSYIPLIGGYISDGFDLILYSSVIIKNAVGVVGLFLIFASILGPIIKILMFKLGLQLVSAILEPVGDGRIGNFTSGCSKILVYPIVLILAVSFMYLLSVGLIMTTANIL